MRPRLEIRLTLMFLRQLAGDKGAFFLFVRDTTGLVSLSKFSFDRCHSSLEYFCIPLGLFAITATWPYYLVPRLVDFHLLKWAWANGAHRWEAQQKMDLELQLDVLS